jgi:hypothetical protein
VLDTKSPKHLEMAQGHISLSLPNRPREARPPPRILPLPNVCRNRTARLPPARPPAHTLASREPHARRDRRISAPTPRTARQPRTAQSASPAAVTPPQQPRALHFHLSGETNGRQRHRHRRQAQVGVPPGPAQPPPRSPRSGSLSLPTRARAKMLYSGSA